MSNLHRLKWFDQEIRFGKYPNASTLAEKFEISHRQAHRDIDYFKSSMKRYELISMMIGHQFQGMGYGVPALKLVIQDMTTTYGCDEIYLSVIHNNVRAIRTYENIGFKPTGEIEEGHHPEPIYCLKIDR
ncbi:GNAT family N-acetyltransferase [Bacillus salitolerans]|uniref:GNAT family N-acetyltransferase n=1 Tax=Bacillus salitolerans TaxID=1437434 RepID=A0ABW4LSB1_9BACI